MLRVVQNPPNPWHSAHVELLGPPPPAPLVVMEEECRSLLSRNDSPDVPFDWSVNPYRGCHHACAYCYARPTHQYLDLGAGTDFERKLVVKTNAAAVLAGELAATRRRAMIAFSGVTDCYQPLEATYGLTRACLQVCSEHRNPVGVITKGALVERDAELLARLHARAGAQVFVSIPFHDDADGRAIEPQAPPPSRRFRTLQVLTAAGVPTGVALAPVIPGLNDHQIPGVLERAAAAGARAAFLVLLRLPAEVAPVFEQRLRAAYPDRADKVLAAVREMRGGRLYRSGHGARMRGEGPRWQVIEAMFRTWCRRLGLRDRELAGPGQSPSLRQGGLFG